MSLFGTKRETPRCPHCFSSYLPGTQLCPLCRDKRQTSRDTIYEGLAPDTVLCGRFRLGISLDESSEGMLFAAWDQKRSRQVFLRVLRSGDAPQRQSRKIHARVFTSGSIRFSLEPDCAFRRVDADLPVFQYRSAVCSAAGSRSNQEDAAGVINGRDFAYGIVCDGMGGMGNGALASGFCLKELKSIFQALCFGPASGILPQLEHFIRQVDQQIAGLQNDHGEYLRCGTTLVCAVLREARLYYASVGDSRLYLVRSGSIVQLTKEHTLQQTLLHQVAQGELTYEQAMEHPHREALTSYVGMGGLRELDRPEVPISLALEDMLLLCSDGLYRALPDAEILSVFSRAREPQEVAQGLIAAALEKRLPHQDNLTAVVMQFTEA